MQPSTGLGGRNSRDTRQRDCKAGSRPALLPHLPVVPGDSAGPRILTLGPTV